MAALFRSSTPSYSSELLHSSLEHLSSIPISISASSFTASQETSSAHQSLQKALQDVTSSKPLTLAKFQGILESLVQEQQDLGSVRKNEVEQVLEIEVLARGITVIWKEAMDVLMKGAMELEREIGWWESVLESRRDVGLYLLQTLPMRLFKLLPRPLLSHINLPALTWPHANQLFHQTLTLSQPSLSSLRTLTLPINNPLTLTRREILASLRALRKARDEAAEQIGFMTSQAPKWDSVQSGNGGGDNVVKITNEMTRIYALLCVILDLPMPIPPPSAGPNTPSRRSKSSSASSSGSANPPPYSPPSPPTLLPIISLSLPTLRTRLLSPLSLHARPSRLTRFWIPLLLLPPVISYAGRTANENKDWVREQVRNAGATLKGWVIGWVYEPLEEMGKTLRGGGEGLGVAPTTVESDQASLQRMVVDLGRDHYHLSGENLTELAQKVAKGDMEDVLRVYEGEMKSPLKNALMGSLVRTLLIQVQKTKVDLSLALLSLDHLLKSQQLTFAFVGLAPSLLVLYGLGGWLKGVWNGEKRGKGRRLAWSQGMRNIEKLLLLAGKSEKEMNDKERGLLVLAVGSMRDWAGGIRGISRDALLDDLRMLENPELLRNDKLRVVERIWRGWGESGKRRLGV